MITAKEAKRLRKNSNYIKQVIPLILNVLDEHIKHLATNGDSKLEIKDFIYKENVDISNYLGYGDSRKYLGFLSKMFPMITKDYLNNITDDILKLQEYNGLTWYEWINILEPIIVKTFTNNGFSIIGSGINLIISWEEFNYDDTDDY